jgi:sortase A
VLAHALERRSHEGDPLGRIVIPKIGAKFVFVEGTKSAELEKGPGHYSDTAFPGPRWTVGIAGHRTAYLAPFRHIDDLGAGRPRRAADAERHVRLHRRRDKDRVAG